MALAVAYQTTVTYSTSTALWTVPSSGAYGTYARDVVITNSGAALSYISAGTAASAAATASSFAIPPGGSVVLTQCQVPAGTIFYGIAAPSTASTSIGFASVVSVI